MLVGSGHHPVYRHGALRLTVCPGQMDILEAAMSTVSDRIEQLEKMLDQGMGGCPCCT